MLKLLQSKCKRSGNYPVYRLLSVRYASHILLTWFLALPVLMYFLGITRLERWERAEKHGLNPPTVVKDILNKHPNDEEYIQW